ncbi:efflux RND transporter permease subunit [Entomobacter blattae]|uniref:Cobalt-zinc-cadmium resistance protein CzcA n=1 Tax=Entomobacter blattae TaxID=2762277 RepID=A0A7H1NQK0_9PROT|nr:CusA/CzcA family heavy metal efflux RND transporter [Entomobacter blattae]QNT78060.1 Cobalt-zinc-cadmium resistance protein CzcA [Entomobacter blattae]
MLRFIKALLRHGGIIMGLCAVLTIAGIIDLRTLPVEPVPDISPKQVMLSVTAPGLPTEEVERLVTLPAETAMAGIPGIVNLRSITRTGLTVLYLQFREDTDIYLDRTLVSQKLDDIRANIFLGNVTFSLGPLATGMGEILSFQLKGANYQLEDLFQIMKWKVIPQLKLVPGVIEVNNNGGAEKTFRVSINNDRMIENHISLSSVYDALDGVNKAVSGNWLDINDEHSNIVGRTLIKDLEDFGNIQVSASQKGSVIHLRDIGEVGFAARPRFGGASRDGKGEIINGVILLQQGASAKATLKNLQEAIPRIQATLPQGVSMDVYYSRAHLTDETIHTVKENLLWGAILVLVVLLVVLGDLRASLVIVSVIPFSLVMAMVGMHYLGISANLLSLGAIDFGMIVDGSLVIVEKVMSARRIEYSDMADLVAHNWTQVVRPVTFAIMIIILVYLPILTLQSVEGRMFRPMGQTVILALIASLLFSLFCIPIIARLCVRVGSHHKDTFFIRFVRKYYTPIFYWCMQNTTKVFGIALIVLVFSGVLATRLGGEFIPQLQEGSLVLNSVRYPSISLDSSLRSVQEIEKVLTSFPDVRTVVSNTGTAIIPTDPQGWEETDTFIYLKPKSEWKTASTQEGLVKAFDEALQKNIIGSTFTWSQPIEMRMHDLLSGVRSQIALSFYGDDVRKLVSLAKQAATLMKTIPGAADVAAREVESNPTLHIDVDRTMTGRLNVDTQEILKTVTALAGYIGPPVSMNGSLIPTQAVFMLQDRDSLDDIRNLAVFNRDGVPVRLSQVTHMTREDTPVSIRHNRGSRQVVVQANVRGRDINSFVVEAQEKIRTQLPLPHGYRVEWGGQFNNMKSALARLEVVVPIAIFLIFCLLIVALGNVALAVLVLVNLPFAATGGIIALYIRGMPFSISASIGFIALFGIAVLNGVVLVSYISYKRQREEKPVLEAIHEAVEDRFRPVMATASVACLGFFPMAFSMSEGGEVEKPLATVVMGGLVSSTALTLLVIPALYARMAKYFKKSL